MSFEQDYAKLVSQVLQAGEDRPSRNGHTISQFATTLSFDLQQEFPLLQGRKMFTAGIFGELAAMLRRPKHINDFKQWGCNYWDKWAEPDGSIRVDYGNAWFDFNGVNQIAMLRLALIDSPESRRMVISGWRPGADLSLPCCHYAYQFYVREGKYIDMMWIQRSADVMIGIPSDAVFAAAWMIALCQEFTWLQPGRCTMVFGDTHIYAEHVEGAAKYLRQAKYVQNTVRWLSTARPQTNFCNFEPNWISIHNYQPQTAIKFELKD